MGMSDEDDDDDVLTLAVVLSLIHISEPTRPLYISYAVFCLKKKSPKMSQNVSTEAPFRAKHSSE